MKNEISIIELIDNLDEQIHDLDNLEATTNILSTNKEIEYHSNLILKTFNLIFKNLNKIKMELIKINDDLLKISKNIE